MIERVGRQEPHVAVGDISWPALITVGNLTPFVLAYVDGETLNLISERVVPGDDVHGRIVDNALRGCRLLELDSAAGMTRAERGATRPSDPRLTLADQRNGT